MKASQRARQRWTQLHSLGEQFNQVRDKSLPDLDYHMNFTITSLVEFINGFELQMESFRESENLSKMRIMKLEASNLDTIFWNELKTNILNRQKSENAELIKATARVAEESERIEEIERSAMQEVNKGRSEEEREAANQNAKVLKVRNVAGRSKNEPKFNFNEKVLTVSVQRGNQTNLFEMKFVPEKAKYMATQEYNPKAMALIGQFNFHKNLPRLQQELTELVNSNIT